MLISGVKHACAKCIRGHRSSSCAHSDRPLFEIRKKGRPVSQCPHCRDLRKIKSVHTKCECGATPGEGSGKGKCQCHYGQPCICAGQPQVFQYIAPDLSGQSTRTATTASTDGARTPTEASTPTAAPTSMLHTFNLAGQAIDSRSLSPVSGRRDSMPPPSAPLVRRNTGGTIGVMTPAAAEPDSPSDGLFDFATPVPPSDVAVQMQPSTLPSSVPQPTLQINAGDVPRELGSGFFAKDTYRFTPPIAVVSQQPPQPQPQLQQRTFTPPVSLPQKRRHIHESSISRSTRSIGTNTDALPPGIWPEDPWEVPAWMESRPDNVSSALDSSAGAVGGSACCPKVRDMPLKDLPFDRSDLAPATSQHAADEQMRDMASVPNYSVFYTGLADTAVPPDARNTIAVSHYGHALPQSQSGAGNSVGSRHSSSSDATGAAGVPLVVDLASGGGSGTGVDGEMVGGDAGEVEFQFDQVFWDKLMEVPGCSLPGVQCRCGDDCSCSGCQTHRDNGHHVAAAELERMDVAHDGIHPRKPRSHPAACCDTRSLHEHGHGHGHEHRQPPSMAGVTVATSGATQGGCCGGKH